MTSRASSWTERAVGSLFFGCVFATGAARAQVPQLFGELHQIFPAENHQTNALAAGDVDGDGDADLVLGNYGEQSRLYSNTGGGVFADFTASHLPALSGTTRAAALSDVDGDGDVDLVLGNYGDAVSGAGQERLFVNDGSGHFSDVTASSLPAVSDPTSSLALGDLDGDGDFDLIVGNATFPTFPLPAGDRLYVNDGSGHFASSAGLPASASPTQALALADVDGDLDLDLLAGSSWTGPPSAGAAQNRLFLNDGAANFADATPTHLPQVGYHTRSLGAGDIDGDGDADLFGGSAVGPNYLHQNDGSGHFGDASATHLPPDVSGENANAVALGDVDGDGDADLVLGLTFNSTSAQNRLLANDGSGHFADVTATSLPAVVDFTRAVLLTDINGDGDRDLVVGNTHPQTFLYRNDGSGHFARLAFPNFPGSGSGGFYDAAVADLDGDGDGDTVATGLLGSLLYRNDGTGFFVDATTTHMPPTSTLVAPIAAGDVDGDGDSDLAIGVGLAQNLLLLNDGTAHFADVSATHMPPSAQVPSSLALGDVDADGDPDLVVGNTTSFSASAQNRLYANDGTGHFADATPGSLPVLEDQTEVVALADVNGDGDLDLIVGEAKHPGDLNRLLQNDGAGHFSDVTASQLPSALDQTHALAVGDVDGDGDADLVTGSAHADGSGAQNHLYRNNGVGVFADATVTHLPSLLGTTSDLVLGDVNGDGDEDLAIANEYATNWLWTNDGTGHFADATTPHFPGPAQETNAVALADVDGDLDRDVLLAGNNGLRIATNLRTQLAWHNPPGVGAPLIMDLYGPPGARWILAVAAGAASIPLPPFGTLALDPLSIQVVKLGVIGALGMGSATFLVPGDIAFLGVSLHWQAAVGVPLVLTNRERTTFGAF